VFAELPWCTPIGLPKGSIEPPKTSEACRQRNLCDWQISFVQQTLGKLKTPGLRKGDWRCSYVLQEQATQMTRAQSQLVSQVIDGGVIENAFIDQAERSSDDG
jgi:hypothetical protein